MIGEPADGPRDALKDDEKAPMTKNVFTTAWMRFVR